MEQLFWFTASHFPFQFWKLGKHLKKTASIWSNISLWLLLSLPWLLLSWLSLSLSPLSSLSDLVRWGTCLVRLTSGDKITIYLLFPYYQVWSGSVFFIFLYLITFAGVKLANPGLLSEFTVAKSCISVYLVWVTCRRLSVQKTMFFF